MKKIVFLMMAIMIAIQSSAQWDGTSAPWTQGTGTESNPYLIESPQHLAYLADMVCAGVNDYNGKYFLLTQDISLSNQSWMPIGDYNHPFKGNFDGGGHIIDSCNIDNITLTNVGFFGKINNSIIRNVLLEINITSYYNCSGGLASHATNSFFYNCTTQGAILGDTAGGFVGSAVSCSFYNSENKTNVQCHHYGGGLAGISSSCIFSKCGNSTDSIAAFGNGGKNGYSYVGGISGYSLLNTSILLCYNTGKIVAHGPYKYYYYGGSTGYVLNIARLSGISYNVDAQSHIDYCYNRGSIECHNTSNYFNSYDKYMTASLLGIGVRSSNCYNTGMMSHTGGANWPTSINHDINIYAIGTGMITNCYYLNTCGGLGNGNSRTEAQMKSVSFPLVLNSDSTVFVMDENNENDGYPIFAHSTVFNVTTVDANNVTSYSAVIYGHFGGAADTVGFIYGLNYSATMTHVISDVTTSPVAHTLTSLQPNSQYRYAFFVKHNGAYLYGDTLTFTTMPLYMVSISSNNSTWGSVCGGGIFAYGETATLIATAENNYQFAQWSDGNGSNPRYLTVTSDTNLIAQFSPANYTLTVVSNNNAWGTVTGSGNYQYGQTVTCTATAAEHYNFVSWNDGITSNPRSFTVAGNTTLTATFAPEEYTVTAISNNSTWGNVSGGGIYGYNETATLTATAVNHYQFSQWSDGNTDNPRIITVLSDTSLTAFFEVEQYTITVSVNNSAWGSATGAGVYDYWSPAILTAVPNVGYHYKQWSSSSGNWHYEENPFLISHVVANVEYICEFEPNQYTVTVLANDSNMGIVSGGGSYNYGQQIYIIAQPIGNYIFTQWSDGETSAYRLLTVTDNITYTAIFTDAIFNITAQSNNASFGTVTGSGSYARGSQVQLTAIPNEGYHFTQWNDGNTENPRTITVNADATYTAQFAANTYVVNVSSSNSSMGSATGGGIFSYGQQITIEATPMPHYRFTQWDDGMNSNPRVVTITSDTTFTAMFEQMPQYIITVVSEDATKGSVSGGGTFYGGEQTVISATASSGNVFDRWSDGNTEAIRTITVTSDATYTAYFSGVRCTVNVYSNDDNMGTVSGGGEYEQGAQATVTATPANGCRFVRWNNGVEQNPYTFTVYSNVNLIANFERFSDIDDAVENKYSILSKGLDIVIDGAENETVMISNVLGQRIYFTSRYNGEQLKMPTTGVYFVKIGLNPAIKIVLIN